MRERLSLLLLFLGVASCLSITTSKKVEMFEPDIDKAIMISLKEMKGKQIAITLAAKLSDAAQDSSRKESIKRQAAFVHDFYYGAGVEKPEPKMSSKTSETIKRILRDNQGLLDAAKHDPESLLYVDPNKDHIVEDNIKTGARELGAKAVSELPPPEVAPSSRPSQSTAQKIRDYRHLISEASAGKAEIVLRGITFSIQNVLGFKAEPIIGEYFSELCASAGNKLVEKIIDRIPVEEIDGYIDLLLNTGDMNERLLDAYVEKLLLNVEDSIKPSGPARFDEAKFRSEFEQPLRIRVNKILHEAQEDRVLSAELKGAVEKK